MPVSHHLAPRYLEACQLLLVAYMRHRYQSVDAMAPGANSRYKGPLLSIVILALVIALFASYASRPTTAVSLSSRPFSASSSHLWEAQKPSIDSSFVQGEEDLFSFPTTGSSAKIKYTKHQVCTFTNICITDRSGHTYQHGFDAKTPTEFALLGSGEELAKYGTGVQDKLPSCFQLLRGQKTVVIDKPEDALIQWVNGTTYLGQKIEKGHHPAAWARLWAILLSAFTWQSDVFAGVARMDFLPGQ